MKKACITGITGQTGSYLAEILLEEGYEVHGLVRRSSSFNTDRIEHIFKDLHLAYGDLSDYGSIANWVRKVQPDEFYNLGAMSVDSKCRLPILKASKIEHPTFEDLWKSLESKHEVQIEKVDDLDVEVINTESSKQLRALGFWNGMGTWSQIRQISRHYYKGKVAKLRQKFGEVIVTPNHSVYDVLGNLTTPSENPWLLNMRKLNYVRTPNIEVFDVKPSTQIDSDEIYCWSNQDNSTKIFKQLSGKKLSSLFEFVGAFIPEGHTTFNKANGSYLVGISNQDLEWLKKIQVALNEFYIGPSCFIRHKKEDFEDVWELQIRSRTLYDWMRKICGIGSLNKKIPDLFLSCSLQNLRLMWDNMIFGDGSSDARKYHEDIWRYGTSSYHLACQFSTLATILGFDYTVHTSEQPPNNNTIYNFRQCVIYQPNQGDKKLIWEDYDGYVYDISVAGTTNFAVGVGNIVVHNSHVRVSFDIPEYTMDIGATGVVRCLEALTNFSDHTHFVQASTSEMFGSVPPPQNEQTILHPRSPYGAAKIAGYWSTVNYREAGKLFAANSMSFNHETVADFMPVIFKEDGRIDIKPISEVVCDHCNIDFDLSRDEYQEGEVKKNIEIWDANGWTKVKFASGYSHKQAGMNKQPRFINARNAAYMATDTHVVIMDGGEEKEIKDIAHGDMVNNIELPSSITDSDVVHVSGSEANFQISKEKARLIGFIVGDGSINKSRLRLTAKNKKKLFVYSDIWERLGGTVSYQKSKSGFSNNEIWQVNLNGNKELVRSLDIYDSFGNKRVPKYILNSLDEIKHEFLIGYNDADGLKKNPCNYIFKNFKTNSATLAMGLIYLVSDVTGQKYNITIEESEKWGYKTLYYSINLLSDNPKNNAREYVKKYDTVKHMIASGKSLLSIHKETGISSSFIHKVKRGYIPAGKSHLEKPQNEVKKIIEINDFDGWFFDLETESGTFHCGIGCGHVHNSPRRGETFVTKKITRAATRIKVGLQEKLFLGNLDAQRDWNHAHDVARAIHLMATAPEADDWVVGSGEMHSVREFLELVFDKLDLDWEEYVEFDERYLRPTEVDALCGDSTKIRTKLGWEPRYTFEQLVDEMVEHDLQRAHMEKALYG